MDRRRTLLWGASGLLWLATPIGGVLSISAAYLLARPTDLVVQDIALASVGVVWCALLIGVGVLHRSKARLVHFLVPIAATAILFGIYQHRMSRNPITVIQHVQP